MNFLMAVLRRGFGTNVGFAWRSILEHKLRSSLTVLGIVVGVTTVIAMVAIVTGFNNNVIGNLQSFGANRVEFQKYEDRFGPGGPLNDEERRRKNLTVEDADAIRNEVPEAAAVSTLCALDDTEVKVKNGNLLANSPYIIATDEFYPAATAYGVGRGRFFSGTEAAHKSLVLVLGSDVQEAIFPSEDPIGKDVTVDGMRYRVVGVLAKKGAQFGYSPDNKVVMPHGAFERQFGVHRRAGVRVWVVPKRNEDFQKVIDESVAVLRMRRKVAFNKPNDFAIITPDQLISQFRAITGGVTGAMVFIALISLVIGGVGVMNIMLVSVKQRTREIGIRKAVGALRRDIIGQFLVEAVTLTSVGGAIGVALGTLISVTVKALVPSLPTSIPLWSPILGLAVSMGVGIFFGAYPAVKASRLDPIESLRYE